MPLRDPEDESQDHDSQPEPRLFTASWHEPIAGVVPIRISRGVPPSHQEAPAIWALVPPPSLFRENYDPDLYRLRIEDHAESIFRQVTSLLHTNGRIALCCHEMQRNRATCHRSVVADFLRCHGFEVTVR